MSSSCTTSENSRSRTRRASSCLALACGIEEIEFDPAAVVRQRQHAVGLQAAGQDVEHGVRIQEVIQRVAGAVQVIAAFQRTELHRVPLFGGGHVAAVIEQLVELGVHVRHMVAFEIIIDVGLPVAVDVVAQVLVEAQVGEFVAALRQPFGDAFDEVLELRRIFRGREHQTFELTDVQRRQADVGDIKIGNILHFGGRAQCAVQVVGPAVVAATQLLGAFAGSIAPIGPARCRQTLWKPRMPSAVRITMIGSCPSAATV